MAYGRFRKPTAEDRANAADPRLGFIAIFGLLAAVLLAIFVGYLIAHPDYVPPCNSTPKGRCPIYAPHSPPAK